MEKVKVQFDSFFWLQLVMLSDFPQFPLFAFKFQKTIFSRKVLLVVNGAKCLRKLFFTLLNRSLNTRLFSVLWAACYSLRSLLFLDFFFFFIMFHFRLCEMFEEILVMPDCLTNCRYLRHILNITILFITLNIDVLPLVLHIGLPFSMTHLSIIFVRNSLRLFHLFLRSAIRCATVWHSCLRSRAKQILDGVQHLF